MELFGYKGKLTAKFGLKNFPFLRFEALWIVYRHGPMSIDEKLQLLQNGLQMFQTALSSNLESISVIANINQNDQSQFRNHSQLLGHLREQVLPICDSSPDYSFKIDFQSDNDGAGNFIGEILQLPKINRCQQVHFFCPNETSIQLPVEVISNWLNRNSGGEINSTETEICKKGRLIHTNQQIKIQNAVEMCDRMKTVITFYFIFNIKSERSDSKFITLKN